MTLDQLYIHFNSNWVDDRKDKVCAKLKFLRIYVLDVSQTFGT